MKTVALIPMRKGSKRIPNKHHLQIAGKSPAVRAVNAALDCKRFDAVYVATNDPAVREQLKDKNVVFFERSEYGADDKARTEVLIDEFLEQVECDIVVLIQATNPFHKAFHLDRAISLFKKHRADSLISGVRLNRYFYRFAADPVIAPLDKDAQTRPGLSEVHGLFCENGAFYIFWAKDFKRTGKLLSGNIVAYEMPFETLIELDEPQDWALAESIISDRIG